MALFPDEFVIGLALLTFAVGVALLAAQAVRGSRREGAVAERRDDEAGLRR